DRQKQLKSSEVAPGCDVRRTAVRKRRDLERVPSLVVARSQRGGRGDPARGHPDFTVLAGEPVAYARGKREWVAFAHVHDRAQHPLTRGDQCADACLRHEPLERDLGALRALEPEYQDRGLRSDAERAQTRFELVVSKLTRDGVGEDVAPEPAFSV